MDRKLLFFVLSLACVSLAASTSWVSRPTQWSPIERKPFRFSPDQTYVYEYRGRLVNGIPKLADQYAGLEIEADLLLQPIDGKQVVMKLDDIKIDQIHAKLEEHYEQSADQLLHNNANTPNRASKKSIYDETETDDESTIDRELLIEYTKELSKPIKFLYVNGKVERFEAESNDQEWSINMKKSILALFQLDLVPTKIIKAQQVWRDINEVNGVKKEAEQQLQQDIATIVDPATGRRVSGQYTPESVIAAGELPLVYPVFEEGFGGICETEYQVDSNENPSSQSSLNYHQNQHHQQQQQQQPKQWESDKFVAIANVLNVTKTINFKNCLTDPSISYDGHKFQSASEQSTLWGSLINKPTQPLAGYYPIPEELKAKYSRLSAASTEKSTAEETSTPVERYAFVKYNISQWQQPGTNNGEQLSLIESVFAEGKIKYRAQGDELVSISHQYLKLVTVKKQQERIESPKNTVVYETIQSELKSSKQKYYESVMRFANSRNSFAGHQQQQQTGAYKQQQQQQMPEFAQSASWYSLVANTLAGNKKNGQKDSMEPEQMAVSVAQLFDSLATDVLTEDLEQSKKAGEKVVQIVNLISLMPKYKLIELYEQLAASAEHRHQQHGQQQRKEVTLKQRIVRKLFLDSLPLSGSKNAVALIAELIESQRCTVSEAKEMVEAVPSNLRFPDTEIIDAFIRVAQNAGVRKQRQLFASCSLACAKMIKNAYEQTKTESYKSTALNRSQLPQHLADDLAASIIATEADPRQQQRKSIDTTESSSSMNVASDDDKELNDEQLVRYIKYYKQMLEKSTQYYEKVIYLETLAHMAVPQVLPILEPYVSGRLSLQQCLGSATSHHLAAPLTSQQLARRQQWTYRNAFQRWNQEQEQDQYEDQYDQQRELINKNKRQQQQQQQKSSIKSIVGDDQQGEWSQDIGMDAEECNHMRSVAIYALAHVARQHPSLVLPLVKPVFENVYEPYQIRIAAFTGALLAQADEPTLERWASQMWREPSQEVVSFVTGSLVTLANMTSPQLESLSNAARKACDSMPQQYVDDWRRSWMSGTDHYNGETKTTLSTFAELIKSNVSMVPRAGYVEFMRTAGPNGEHTEQVFQIGFAAKGIENVLRDFVGIDREQEQEHDGYATKRGADIDNEDSILSLVFDNLFQGVDEISQWWNEIRESYEQETTGEDKQTTVDGQQRQSFYKQRQHYKQQQSMLKGKLAAGSNTKTTQAGASLKEKLSSQYTRQEQQQWIYGKRRTVEEPKLALFAKLFGSTSYYALDKKQMQQVLNGADAYLLDMAKDLMSGHKTVHYVKMMMPASMWHMTPSQLGLPVFVTHREPLLISFAIKGQQQQQQDKTQQQQQQKSTMQLSTIVHPKIMHSNVNFMFAVDCVSRQAYGVTTNKMHQISLPFEATVEYSRAKQLVSVAVAPKVNKQQIVQSIESAKTFIGEVRLAHNVERNWLGQSRVIRDQSGEQLPLKLRFDSSKQFDRSSESRRASSPLGVDVQVDITTDDTEFDWSFDMQQADQHRKGGPMAQWLHVIDALQTRPCKHQEIRVQLKSDSLNKQPVYRFDFDLATKQLKQTTDKLEGEDAKRSFGRRTVLVTKQAMREQHDKQTWERALDQIESTDFVGQRQQQQQQFQGEQQQQQYEQVQFEKMQPIRRQVIVKQGNDKMCVSTEKIDVCPVGSFAYTISTSQPKKEIVQFRCFDKRTPTGEQLAQRYYEQQQQIEKTKSQLLAQTEQLIIDSIMSNNNNNNKSHMRTSMPYVDINTMESLQQIGSYERQQDMRQTIETARSCITTVY